MLEVIVLAASIFGHGNWLCANSSVYSDGMVETIFSHVITADDFSYQEVQLWQYKKESDKSVKSQARAIISGQKKVIGENEFSAISSSVNIHIDFDEYGVFTEEYINLLYADLSAPSNLVKILSRTNEKMVLVGGPDEKQAICYPGFDFM